MKIDFSKILNSIDDEPLKDEKDKVWTLEGAATEALLATYRDEPDIKGAAKRDRFVLALKVKKSLKEDDVDFTIEEVATIKDLIGKAWNASIVGAAWNELEEQQK